VFCLLFEERFERVHASFVSIFVPRVRFIVFSSNLAFLFFTESRCRPRLVAFLPGIIAVQLRLEISEFQSALKDDVTAATPNNSKLGNI